ncbi:MAG: hypothetical protein U9N45_03820 [Gemmatimonadota bacterium]|nr:hypothetical protein [Gemmatimonadota bacterium]
MNEKQKKKLFRKLLYLFIFSFLMSNGPGLYLVNKPVLILGMPVLYLWGLCWAVVQIGIILYAYFKLWKEEIEDKEPVSAAEPGKEARP